MSAYRFAIADVICDISEGVIENNDRVFQLEPRLSGVLALLVQRGKTTVTRDEFLATVWDDEGSDEALTQAISRLRKVLGDSSLIETVPRIGYRLSVSPQPIVNAQQELRPSVEVKPILTPRLLAIGIVLLMLVFGSLAFWLGTHHNTEPAQEIELEIEKGANLEFHKIPEQTSD